MINLVLIYDNYYFHIVPVQIYHKLCVVNLWNFMENKTILTKLIDKLNR